MRNRVLPIGLDIGHSVIKMVQLVLSGDDVRVLAVERSPVPGPGQTPGSPERESLVHAIHQMHSRGHFKGHNVVSTLPNENLRITSVRLSDPEMASEEQTLRKDAAQRFGLDPDKDAIEYLPAGSVMQDNAAKNEYIVLAAAGEAVRAHISLLEDAGLRPVGIDAAPCALFRNFERMMRRQEDRERTIVFIDVGHFYTTVVFGRSGELCLIKQMALGAARFDEDVAAKLGVSLAEARSLRVKLRDGETMDAAVKDLVSQTLRHTADQLAGEIALCLRYYTVTFRGKRVERAIVAGGGAYEPVLLNVIANHLSVETEIAEPLRGFDLSRAQAGRALQGSTADLALAMGLSLKGWRMAPGPAPQHESKPEPVLEGRPS